MKTAELIHPKKNCKKKGENDYIYKRYLNASKLDLYHQFCQEQPLVISYTTFKKYCPQHCIAPTLNERDTCGCPIHVNFFFLVHASHMAKVLNERSAHQIIKNVTCPKITEECLNRNCPDCKEKETVFNSVEDTDKELAYKKWITKTEKRISATTKKEIIVTFIAQQEYTSKISEVMNLLKEEIKGFFDHNYRVFHQYKTIKQLKENIKNNDRESLFLWDFSENYNCKYKVEPQSMLYGATRSVVTLHTGYLYSKNQSQGNATLSEDLDHKSAAVIAHIDKILECFASELQNVDTVHFLSDSPSSQYRNQPMFYLLTQYLMSKYPQIKYFTHNYSETYYGKDEKDGIGGVLKTTGDNEVKYNKDIPNFKTFLSVKKEEYFNFFNKFK